LDTIPFDEQLHEQSVALNEDNELVALLQSKIAKLKLDERTSVTLFYIHGCSIDEISAVMDKPAGTIKNLLFRVRKKLKDQLLPVLLEEAEEAEKRKAGEQRGIAC
jgi:RNA polymerase sigma factor (sigma-70 family)